MVYKCNVEHNQSAIIDMIVKNNPDVTEVDLSSSGIAAGHTEELAAAISNNTHLISLDLSNNGLVDDSWNRFLKELESNNTLRKLNIKDTSCLGR